MIKTRIFKKTLTFILALSMLLCCVGAFGSVQASAATDRVSMYLTDHYFAKYESSSTYIYIQTKDNASNQEVYVHYHIGTSTIWKDVQAEYFTTLSDGSKIWRADLDGRDIEYAIKYIADGQIFWDNNNGNNYTDEVLGSAPITVTRNYYLHYNNYEIKATLQNYSYQKNVYVRYTEDNWATFKDIPLTYKSTNNDGTENWSTSLSVDSDKVDSFEYCVYYMTNGQTYWANNFGRNYNTNYLVYP